MVAVYADAVPPLDDVNRQLFKFIEVYEHNGSGWVFSKLASFQLTLWHLDPLRVNAFVPLPRWIQTKRAVVNVIRTGDDCFKWAVLAEMHPLAVNGKRMENYVEHTDTYDFSSLRFPVSLSSIASFAKANNINVYGIDDDQKVIYPLRVLQAVVTDRHVDLLLYECNSVQHYTTIKNFSSLVSGHLSNHNCATYCCKKCLHAYWTQKLPDAHAEDCCHAQSTKFPKDPICRFTNIQKQLQAPFVVYADFESILKPVNEDVDVTQGVHTDISSSHVFQEHILCSLRTR